MGDEVVARHLEGCFRALYGAYGELAPRCTRDAYVIRTYEAARAFGAVAARFRGDEEDAPANTLIDALVRHAGRADETGAMALYCLAMVVGPRLLVSVRDARDVLAPSWQATLNEAADVLVREIRRCGEVAQNQAPIEDPSWLLAARDLDATAEAAGALESFGLGR